MAPVAEELQAMTRSSSTSNLLWDQEGVRPLAMPQCPQQLTEGSGYQVLKSLPTLPLFDSVTLSFGFSYLNSDNRLIMVDSFSHLDLHSWRCEVHPVCGPSHGAWSGDTRPKACSQPSAPLGTILSDTAKVTVVCF